MAAWNVSLACKQAAHSPFQHQLRWIQKNRKTCVVVVVCSGWNCFQTVFRKHLLHSPQTDVQTQAQLSQTSWIAQKQALCRPATSSHGKDMICCYWSQLVARKPHAYSDTSPFQHQLRWIQKKQETCVVVNCSDWNCFPTVFRKHLLHSPQTDFQTQAQLSQTSWIAQKQALCKPATSSHGKDKVNTQEVYCHLVPPSAPGAKVYKKVRTMKWVPHPWGKCAFDWGGVKCVTGLQTGGANMDIWMDMHTCNHTVLFTRNTHLCKCKTKNMCQKRQ